MDVLRCTIGWRDMAIRVGSVREIVRASGMVAPLFGGTPVVGLVNVRGRVVPVVDWEGGGRVREQVVVVEDASGAWLGVGIDAGGAITQASPSSGGGAVTVEGETLPLLDPDRLVG